MTVEIRNRDTTEQGNLYEALGNRYTAGDGWNGGEIVLFRFRCPGCATMEDVFTYATILRRHAGFPTYGDETVTGVRGTAVTYAHNPADPFHAIKVPADIYRAA